MKKAILVLCGIMLLMFETFTPRCVAEESKRYTDEFLFVNSYLDRLANYSKADYSMCIQIRLVSTERNINYSADDVLNSDSMKQLKKEQEFISGMIRAMDGYSDSSVENINKVANVILKKYLKKQALNVKAQDTYFYTKTGQFKAGVLTADELFDEEKAIGDDYWQAVEEEKLFREILFPGINAIMRLTYEEKRDPQASIGSSVMRITYEEKNLLLEKTRQLKKRFSDAQHLGDWQVKFFLQNFEQFLMIDFPCLKEVE